MFEISRLHYITQDHIQGHDHASLANAACEGGVDWVQLRAKNLSYENSKKEALLTKEVCRHYGAKFIINDHVELAKEIKADGVHLGKTDMDPVKAREILGPEFIIGGTANTFKDIIRLSTANVNYIGVGPFRFTSTKENLSPLLGIEGFKDLLIACKNSGIDIPLIAIGGIVPEDIPQLLAIDMHGVAVSSFINKSDDKATAARKITDILYKVV